MEDKVESEGHDTAAAQIKPVLKQLIVFLQDLQVFILHVLVSSSVTQQDNYVLQHAIILLTVPSGHDKPGQKMFRFCF